ncbi:hypothetical protein N7491_005504 [Penicillium cf. griseofulvum]|uniref:Uncharacterized protein n=1 Tax=Penicillium cf. griseofulvum TaxID=2972120 RepID=A0A9W9J6H9_9EURO|nr:hypothetical protein N7472_008194 [Penicillium cf. griseofulvum]KAJ5434909.1 hypothetical protein N7491_005504 [Penicillium cf. griseofulvum]KAJ5452742.1 hypothetical protein N7445_000925 [Penicillium cf. griseofulvum]
MFSPKGNPEQQFLRTRAQFKSDLQLEIDAIMSQKKISPLRLALAVDNLTDLIDEVRVLERASATMCREMPRCRTILNGCGYYGYDSKFLAKTHKLEGHLITLKDNIMPRYSDRHWISRQIGLVSRYSDL